MKKIVWVTGATGFTGRFMVRFLRALDKPPYIVGVDIRSDANSLADEDIAIDLTNWDQLRSSLASAPPDLVIHLAGLLPPADEHRMTEVNVGASKLLARALSQCTAKSTRVLSVGSAAEYGEGNSPVRESDDCRPENAYGRSKLLQTRQMLSVNAKGVDVVVARPFNLLGPGLSDTLVAGTVLRQLRLINSRNNKISPTGPVESIRDFVDVRDVVAAFWKIALYGKAGHIYNVCTGRGTSIQRLIEIMQEELGTAARVVPDYDESVVSADKSVGDNRKLVALGWAPEYSVRESVASMISAACK